MTPWSAGPAQISTCSRPAPTPISPGGDAVEGDLLYLQGQSYVLGSGDNGDAVLTLSGGGTITLYGIPTAQFSSHFLVSRHNFA